MGRSFERATRALIPIATTVVGGMIGGPTGAGIGYGIGNSLSGSKDKGVEQPTVDTTTTTTNVSTPLTPEGSVTGKGKADLSDTGLNDVISVFDMFNNQDDEMDKLLKRKFY